MPETLINMRISLIIFAFINFNVYYSFCQVLKDTESHQSYNLIKLIQYPAKHFTAYNDLKSATTEDKISLNEVRDLLEESVNSILVNLLYQHASNKCFKDLMYVFENVRPGSWGANMLDAFGKPESGLFLGNVKWLGEYDECLSVYAPPKATEVTVGEFHGKYCTLNLPINLTNIPLKFSMGVCLPDSCSPSSFPSNISINLNSTNPFSVIIEEVNSLLNETSLTCPETLRKFNAGAIAVICLISLFAFLAVIGSSITIYEYLVKVSPEKDSTYGTSASDKPLINADVENLSPREPDEVVMPASMHHNTSSGWLREVKPFLNCFCFFTNGKKVIDVSSTEGQLPCLHGIRFLSMSWVILGHTYATSTNAMRNLIEAATAADHWSFQIILNGFYSVDSFFVLSGFLVAYLYFQQSAKTNGKVHWLYFYVHRYIRLTPVYMIVLAFFTFLSPHLGSGPLWPDTEIDPNCEASWWWNLLYINNFQLMSKQCVGWAWYLANDMQFYIISPLFLVTLWKWPKIGYFVMGLFFCIAFTANFAITYEYNLFAGLGDISQRSLGNNQEDIMHRVNDWFDLLYTKPYSRISPYLVGIVVAFYLFKRKQNNSGRLHWGILLIGWVVASSVTLTCIFGLYHNTPSLLGASFYNALDRLLFGCGVAWVIFVCVIGQGGAVNSFLSWKTWVPLSRLTFCAYLVHPIVQGAYYSSLRKLIEFSNITVVIHFLGLLIISYGVAFATSLLFESPIIRLERLIKRKFAS